MNFRPRVTGRSLEYKLNRIGARTEPWGRPLRWGLKELVSLPMCTLKRRSRSSRPTSRVNQYGEPDSLFNHLRQNLYTQAGPVFRLDRWWWWCHYAWYQTYRHKVDCQVLIDLTEFTHKQCYCTVHWHTTIVVISFCVNINVQFTHFTPDVNIVRLWFYRKRAIKGKLNSFL